MVQSKKLIKLGDNNVIIVGIINNDDSMYKKSFNKGYFDSGIEYTSFLENYVYKNSVIYVNGFTKNVSLPVNKDLIIKNIGISYKNMDMTKSLNDKSINTLNNNVTIVTNNGFEKISKLNTDEIIISLETLKEISKDYNDKLNIYLRENSSGVYNDLIKDFTVDYLANKENMNFSIMSLFNYLNNTPTNVNIVGISLDGNEYISTNIIDEYVPITKEIYKVKIYQDDLKKLQNIFNNHYLENYLSSKENIEAKEYYTIKFQNDNDVSTVILAYDFLSIYILIISLIFCLFTFLLFSNFISVSISYCKKEIGILRAIGASENDVIKIFGYESIIIGILSWIISVGGYYYSCYLLNKSLFGNLDFILKGITTKSFVPIGMFVYTIFIAIIITLISVSRITKIKPIDAINNK